MRACKDYVALFADKRRALIYEPGSDEPAEREDAIDVHGVTVDLAALYAGLLD